MLMFRDEGVDWAQLAADGRSKALFQKLVDWAADLKRRGLYAGVEALAPAGKTVRRKGAGLVVDGPFAEGREAVLGSSWCASTTSTKRAPSPRNRRTPGIGGTTEVRMLGAFPKP